MSSSHSSRFGYVVLLALLVLWPVMVFVRQRRQSLAYQPMSDEDFVLAVVGIVGALAAVFLPILIRRLRRRRAEGDVHDYVRELERRTVAQPTRPFMASTRPAADLGRKWASM